MMKQLTEPARRHRAAGLPAARPPKPPPSRGPGAAAGARNAGEGSRPDGLPDAGDAGLEALDRRRHDAISEAAYFLAEKRGFQAGFDIDDWLQAERDLDPAA